MLRSNYIINPFQSRHHGIKPSSNLASFLGGTILRSSPTIDNRNDAGCEAPQWYLIYFNSYQFPRHAKMLGGGRSRDRQLTIGQRACILQALLLRSAVKNRYPLRLQNPSTWNAANTIIPANDFFAPPFPFYSFAHETNPIRLPDEGS